MELTEKQKNCPYCHIDSDGNIKLIASFEHDEDYLNDSDSIDLSIYNRKLFCDVYVARDGYEDSNLDREFDFESSINYCPMCGRRLSNESITGISGV